MRPARGRVGCDAVTGSEVVVARDLTYSYVSSGWTLQNLSLEVRRGEIVVLAGPNGSGKSTLLELIGTTRRKTGGELRLLGQSVGDNLADIRKRLAFVTQKSALVMELSVYDNLYLSCSFHGFSPSKARNRANELAELFGLAHKASQSVNRLSGGMIRRVALARAFAGDPHLLLLDEPTVGLDAESKEQFHNFLLELVRPGNMAVVIASHDPIEMSRLCDRRIELDDGHMVSKPTAPAQTVEEQVSVTVWFLRPVGDESIDVFSKWANHIERVDRRALRFHLSGAVSLNRFLKVLGTAEPIVGVITAETGIGVASA